MKTILILSKPDDISTSNVMKWIHYLDSNIQIIRLDSSSLYNCKVDNIDLGSDLIVKIDSKIIDAEEINVVWTRKWGTAPKFNFLKQKSYLERKLNYDVIQNLQEEFEVFFQFFIYKLSQNKLLYWLNKPLYIYPNKLIQLILAKECGLCVPYSSLTSHISEKELTENKITKHLSNCFNIHDSNGLYGTYTTQVESISTGKDFFCSLIQEKIDKKYEIRSFYLAGRIYSIAIFSQSNIKTKIDYRFYDYENPNREEYIKIPEEIHLKIKKLMNKLHLETGSIDFIVDKNGKYIFLEVNPCGQYDIFNMCNIYPDKLIASHLISKSYGKKNSD